ncbi:Transposase IS116/IS110/IS902 family protein [compost metagenome]
MKQSALCKKIAEVPGIGPITATAMVAAVGDAKQFRNGRHLAAWLGLVPRQYSSGGKPRLHGISRRGDTYLRTLLIHGARAVLRYSTTKTDPQSVWLLARRGHNCAAVALANKNARRPGAAKQRLDLHNAKRGSITQQPLARRRIPT